MRLWLNTLLRLLSGAYFVLTSLYCLLAFLPYTYCAFIKAPPYLWMPWFTHHQGLLFWMAAGAGAFANWPLRKSWAERNPLFLLGAGLWTTFGVALSIHPFLPGLQSNRSAYVWSLAALVVAIGMAWWQAPDGLHGNEHDAGANPKLFGYSSGVLVAAIVSVVYLASARARIYSESHSLGLHASGIEVSLWSLVSHVALALAVLSALNLIYLTAARTPRPRTIRRAMTGTALVIALSIVLERFLNNAMSFDGAGAWTYAVMLALAVVVEGFSAVVPWLNRGRAGAGKKLSLTRAIAIWITMAVLIALAMASRMLIGGEDWNGFVGATWALVFWIAMSLCFYRVRPARAEYSATAVLGVLLVGAFVYKGLQVTQIFWATPLGSTEDEISMSLEAYGEHDASFLLAHHVLGNARNQSCGDLCRILREYTNIRDTHISQGVRLVDHMEPAPGERPNIFIFVIDSMRPDYLGAYNPELVHYTPNLDALARDGVAFHNVWTNYSGTSMSEPAIWAGAQLLHTHFPQPFDEVNSLRTLARTDGYQMVASYDTVLRQLFSPSEGMTRLDTEKSIWNQFEACSTVEQLESTLNSRVDKRQPVFFYAQPMNVHQFARNDVPSPTSAHWQSPDGLNGRITYEVHWVDTCLGGFFEYLKQRSMYDNSIIVIASDHGDATGEFGRSSHSVNVWPENMRVPLIMHVPARLREGLVYDDHRISALIDIAPTLYYLLGHRPIRQNPLYGRPLLARTKEELESYPRGDMLLASDVRAVYGILTEDGRYFYTTYDSPAQSYLFDLQNDYHGEHSILTPALKQRYDEEIIEQLHGIGDYYGFKPGVGSLLASTR